MTKVLVSLILLLLLAACNDKPEDGTSEVPAGLTVTPGQLDITILNPSVNGTSLSSYSIISGHCGIPGSPVEVSGGGISLYSICQNDYSWAAPISAVSQPEGSVLFTVKLKDKLLSTDSPSVQRSFIKKDGLCFNADNRGKVYANIDSADGVNTPYKICTPTQFSNIRFNPNKKFAIAQDIDFADVTVTPIAVAFTGELDGQGFVLKDFVVKDLGGAGTSVGLFKYAQGATIKNLNIKNATVEGNNRVGIIAGDWRGGGLIENVKVQGRSKGITMVGGVIGLGNTSFSLVIRNLITDLTVNANNYAGGVISYINTNDGSFTVENSTIRANVNGNTWTGGVAGHVYEDNVTFTNVTHRGDVYSLTDKVGGLFGEANGGSFTNVSHIGSVKTIKDNVDTFVGGLFGITSQAVTINGANVVSNIMAGGNYTGGLIGRFFSGSINNAIARVTITVEDDQFNSPQKFVGGLVGGSNLTTTITNSHAVVNLNAKAYYVGGLIGNMNGATSSISNSWTTGEISGRVSHIGGLVGNFMGASVDQSFSRANINVSGPTPNAYIGGVIGFTNTATSMSKLYHSGNINILDGVPDMVGGVFGYVKSPIIKQVYASGNITGARSKIGGIAGYLWGNLSESFFAGTVNANFRYIGGLAGVAFQSQITDSFVQSNLIQGSGEVGGLVGWMVEGNSATLQRTYFSGDIKKNSTSTFEDSTLGPITGIKDTNVISGNNFYNSASTFIRLADISNITINNEGSALSSAALRAQASYTGYNFVDGTSVHNWLIPATGYKLPFKSSDYLFAIHDWMMEPNQGFSLPITYTDDPINEVQSEIFNSLQHILSSFSQDEIDIIASSNPPTTVTAGQLKMTFLSPPQDGTPIATKMLIYGECGIPGAKISLSGSFVVNTVCQSNYRWSAVIDASQKPAGNLLISAKQFNLAQTTSSPVITRVLNKNSTICSDTAAINGIFANSHLGANGTTIPYKICHAGHLRNIAYYPSGKFELANDIDFGGNTFDPILSTFKGELDGKNFKFRNIVISKGTRTSVGIFSAAQDATLKNITFDKFNISGYDRVGVFAGDWRGTGTIQNVTLQNGIVAGVVTTGGLIGLANTAAALQINGFTIKNTTISGNNNTAGFVGYISSTNGSFQAQNITLQDLTINGLGNVGAFIGISLQPNLNITGVNGTNIKVTGLAEKVSAFLGNIHSATLTDVNIAGELNAPKDAVEISAGGIVGEASQSLNLNNIRWSGPISSGSDNVGGVVGKVLDLVATNIISSGTITINDDKYNSVRKNIGGLVGLNLGEASSVENSSSSMVINAIAQFTGGLFGRFEGDNSVIKNCYFNGTVNARTSYVGGLAGIFDGKDLWDSYSTGDVNVSFPTPNANIGGLLGYANSKVASFKRLKARGNVTITNGLADYVGGLIGFFRAGSLEDSLATGNVTGARIAVGGLIGMMRGSLLRSYSTGNVSASGRHVGGLVGYLNLDGVIQDSFTTGNVTAGDESGGLVGHLNTTHTNVAVLNSYAFGQVARQATSSADEANFGPIYGTEVRASQLDQGSVYYLTSKKNANHNSYGTGLSDSGASIQNSFNGYDFVSTPGWRIPNATTDVPGYGTNYPYPIFTWIGEGTSTISYDLSGSIAGLQYSSISLNLNSGLETIVIDAPNTTFSFTQKLEPGQNYSVVIENQPNSPAITCTLSNASGVMGNGNVSNIVVTCPTFQSIAIGANSNMAAGSNQIVSVNGTLSNSVVISLTGIASLTSSNNTNFSLSSSTLTANSSGSTTLSSNFLGLNSTKSVTAFAAPMAPTSVAWSGSSPSSVPTLTAQWALSVTPAVVSQRIDYFNNNNCSGSPASSKVLTNAVTSDSFTGSDAITYSFNVTSIDNNNLFATSSCSGAMLVSLPTPSPVTSLIASTTWISGALPASSPLYSWTNPQNITGIEIALGTTTGGQEVKAYTAIGNITSYNITNLSSLSNCVPYYASVRAVNQYGKKSSAVTHTAGFKWDNTVPVLSGSLVTSGTASAAVAKAVSWTAATDNCSLNSYEMAIGTSAGASDTSSGWKNIGNVTSFQPVSGANGFSFSLAANTTYYTSVRAKDQAGNYSTVLSSAGWQLPSTGMAKIFWFDASDRTSIKDSANKSPDDAGFAGTVRNWLDKSSLKLDAFSSGASTDPNFDTQKNNVIFPGASQYLRLPTHASFDSSTYNFKNIFVSFKTSIDVSTRQVIYEQGDRNRGINIYLLSGKLYCGFWNTNNDGDGAQAIVTTNTSFNLAVNTNYHVAFVYDYTNYTGATGPDGSIKCYLNNSQFGSTLATTSRLFGHGGGASLGASYGGTRYHDTNTNKTGEYFNGRILEAISYDANPTAAEVSSTINALMAKWSSGELSNPGNLAIVNNSTLTKAVTASWTAISSSNFQTDHYEVAIGTTTETGNILFWSNIGNVTSYTPENGVDGLNFQLAYDTDYYFMVKAVDIYGNESLSALSQAWRVLPPGSTSLAGTFLSIDASDFASVLDGAGVAAGNTGFANVVATWKNTISAGVNDFTQTSAANRPQFNTSLKSAIFDGSSKYMSAAAETNLGNSTVSSKIVTTVFTTSTDVNTRQFIFELGDRNRGLSIYIESGELYCLFQQNSSGGDGAQAPVWRNTTLAPNTSYVVTLYLDYSNYTSSTGPDGNVGCVVNGTSLGTVATTSRWYATNTSAFIGYRSTARWHNANSNGSGDYFLGELHELQMTNTWPANGETEIESLHQNLMNKW